MLTLFRQITTPTNNVQELWTLREPIKWQKTDYDQYNIAAHRDMPLFLGTPYYLQAGHLSNDNATSDACNQSNKNVKYI